MKKNLRPPEDGHIYYAFISYKHSDEKWAVWLQRRLQAYRLPLLTRKQHPELPERLSPVFLDKTNLTPGILDDGLKDEVQSSKFLIVICSRSAFEQSKYLDDEIGYFLEGGADVSRIIPFIVDASEKPERDCFPKRLREICAGRSILGANIHEAGPQRALLKVIACMQGLKLEEIESAERRRRRRAAGRAAAAAVILTGVLAFGGWKYWDYYVPKTRMYVDYTERYGIPEGIGELSDSEASRAGSHYTLVSVQGRVREMRHENSFGRICAPEETEDLSRPAKAVYEYAEDGSLNRTICYDEHGRASLALDYVNANTADLTQYSETDSYAEASFLRSHMTANGSQLGSLESYTGDKSSIVRYLIDYDENGFVREIRYSSNPLYNLAATDADGIGGIRYERDEKGRPVRIQYLACTGSSRSAAVPEDYEPAGTRGGIFEIRLQYDDHNDMISCAYAGEDGRLVRSARNLASEIMEYDDFHNLIRNTCYGEDGSPAVSSEGCACFERTVDEHGCIIRETYFDVRMEEAPIGYGYCHMERELDESGNILKESYYDRDGNLVPDFTGTSFQTCVYDDRGQVIEKWKYGPDGKLVLNDYGIAGMKTEFDENGNVTKISYFGTDREPVLCRERAAVITEEYDENGNPVLTRMMGTDGQPVSCIYGYAQMGMEYDSRGNLTRVRYLDEEGNPTLNNEGLSVVEKECDERGKITRLSYFGTDGEPVLSYEGAASLKQEYDEYGNLSAVSCFGTDGEPVINRFGYARMEIEYDSRANMTEQRIYGTDGEPAENVYGWSVWNAEYDKNGNIAAEQCFAADGTLLYEGTGQGDASATDASADGTSDTDPSARS